MNFLGETIFPKYVLKKIDFILTRWETDPQNGLSAPQNEEKRIEAKWPVIEKKLFYMR